MQDPKLYAEFNKRLDVLSRATPLSGNKVDVLKHYFHFDTSQVSCQFFNVLPASSQLASLGAQLRSCNVDS